jgi:hypothetical protein
VRPASGRSRSPVKRSRTSPPPRPWPLELEDRLRARLRWPTWAQQIAERLAHRPTHGSVSRRTRRRHVFLVRDAARQQVLALARGSRSGGAPARRPRSRSWAPSWMTRTLRREELTRTILVRGPELTISTGAAPQPRSRSPRSSCRPTRA